VSFELPLPEILLQLLKMSPLRSHLARFSSRLMTTLAGMSFLSDKSFPFLRVADNMHTVASASPSCGWPWLHTKFGQNPPMVEVGFSDWKEFAMMVRVNIQH
jgi:hypothetical protein